MEKNKTIYDVDFIRGVDNVPTGKIYRTMINIVSYIQQIFISMLITLVTNEKNLRIKTTNVSHIRCSLLFLRLSSQKCKVRL